MFNKSDLVSYVREKANLSAADAQAAVEAVFEGIGEALASGEDVRFVGFGSFSVNETKAREGRNPRTGETISIQASKKPVFKAGKELKERVNK